MPRNTALAFALALVATPVAAQDAADPALTAETASVGDVYERSEGDWTVRCQKTLSGADPCTMTQLLTDEQDNPVMEAEVIRVSGEDQRIGVLLLNAPLMTLLPQGIRFAVDDQPEQRLSFLYCNAQLCQSRVDMTGPDVETLKRGAVAEMSIVPVEAPDQAVVMEMSLSGFTAAFDSLPEL